MTWTGHINDMDMTRKLGFQDELRDVLRHLYDPTYPFPDLVAMVLGVTPRQGIGGVQAVIIRAIRDLEPAADVPRQARAWRLYRILSLRYLEQLTQEDAALRLAITVRHLAREQAQAINLLAQHLWKEKGEAVPTGRRHLQVEEELASLREHAPGMVTDVGKALQDVAELTGVLTSKHDISTKLGPVESGVLANVHPSVLRQVLVATITYLARAMTCGQIDLSANSTPEGVEITIAGAPTTAAPPQASWLGRELLAAQGGNLDCRRHDNGLSFTISLPSARNVTVLVVDDNEDLVHFYGLCTAGTIYQLVDVGEGRRVFEMIEAIRPDIIMLDLMLPDMDGWELLAQLHEHSLSRSTPVIVCSVIREEELAFALGAAVYVAKPVRRQQFIRALDQALGRVVVAEPRAPENNAATC